MSIHDVFIKNVKIQNYRSLEDVSVTLNKGLNVIIGDNGAGKSNFLKFLDNRLLESMTFILFQSNKLENTRNTDYSIEVEYKEGLDVLHLQLEQSTILVRQRPKEYRKIISLNKLKNGNQLNNFRIMLPASGATETAFAKLRAEAITFRNLTKATLIHFGIPGRIPYINIPGKITLKAKEFLVAEESEPYYSNSYTSPLFSTFETEIEKELSNISLNQKKQTEVIREIIFSWLNKKKRESKYAALLKDYSPIRDIKLNENINIYKTGYTTIIENIVLNFKINNNWVPWSYLSDGTTRLFHIITEVLFNESNIILIEEPELGIHPNQLFKLMDFLKEQAEKKQIIISTHSPISLDALSPDELDQIIIAKMTKHGTTMQHLDSGQISKAKAYMNKVGNLSAYWLHSDLEQ